jgi:EAL domain-containing protein (putative c-di-GMP-specific phosphodiesterase class I)
MSDKDITSQIEKYYTKIVFEISETEYIPEANLKLIMERIEIIKSYGNLIAIDNIGKGYNSVPLIIEVKPDFLKLDRYFSNDLAYSKQKQTFITLLKKYCDQQNCRVILEDLEKDIDLNTGKSLGIRYVQGYLLGRPGLLKKSVNSPCQSERELIFRVHRSDPFIQSF